VKTLTEDPLDLVLKVANCEVRTNTEVNKYFEMGIWRAGITA
jgi:hypothetical protein